MRDDPKSLRMTVFYDEDTDEFCHCTGDFYKTCPLRAAHDLPCKDSIVRISPVAPNDDPKAARETRSLDASLGDLKHSLRKLHELKKI